MITSTEILQLKKKQNIRAFRIKHPPLPIASKAQLDTVSAISQLDSSHTALLRPQHTPVTRTSAIIWSTRSSLLLQGLCNSLSFCLPSLPPDLVGSVQFKSYHHREDLPAPSTMLSNHSSVLTIHSSCLFPSYSLLEIDSFVYLLILFSTLTMEVGVGLVLFPAVSSSDKCL